mmetsp:Transcript_32188/g.48572  ORF Transcript_32188/g.48572 Transcript_32188/m.48572 type:complete len:561 (+) Transcript_32188:1-1683(+)
MRMSRATSNYVLTSSLFFSSAFAFVSLSASPRTRLLRHALCITRGGSTVALEEAITTKQAYDNVVEHLQSITHLSRASAVLSYDQMVFMPQTEQASKARGEQSAALAAVIHEKSIDPKLGEWLQKAFPQTDEVKARVVALAKKAYDKKTKIPTALASKQASLSSEAYQTWTGARAKDDFSLFQGVLGQGIDVAKEAASVIQTEEDKMANKSLYATMLDEYEVGMDPERIDDIFGQIKDALVPLIAKVLGPGATAPDISLLKGNFDIPAQEALSKQIVRSIGYDDSNGRIDVSVHPFSSGISKHDVRITSRFSPNEWYQGLAGSIHEAGHAMYEQNLGDSGLPIDAALSMGMHESQSLFWERHIGLSKAFWQYAAPIVKDHLGIADEDASPEALYAAVNAANRSLIRVEADELTYPLHVILRYRLERDFIEGKLDVSDIPAQWNQGMKDLLEVDVPSDAQGCLQDVHWSMLAYGYFPTYLIGAATAAQWAHYCQKDIPDFEEKIANGDFAEIKAWMTTKVHQHGSWYTSLDNHLEAQVGEPLNPKYFIDYLTAKYCDLYKC